MKLIAKKIRSLINNVFTVFLNKKGLRGPDLVDLSITSACNHKCYFCDEHSYFRSTKPQAQTLNDEVLNTLFEDFIKLRVKRINLGGNGEQLLIPKTIELIKQYGDILKFQVSSNGSSLNKIDAHLFSKIDQFCISINSINPKTHQLIHGYFPGQDRSQLPEIIENVKRLLALPNSKDKVLISYAISNDNFYEFQDLLEIVKSWKCDFSIRPVHLIFDEMKERGVGLNDEQLIFIKEKCLKELNTVNNPGRVKEILKSIINNIDNYYKKEDKSSNKKLKPCYSGYRIINIWASGEVHQCTYSQTSLGNIYDARFKDLWNQNHFKKRLAQAALMHITNDSPYKQCRDCIEPHSNSAFIHKALSLIPFGNYFFLLRRKKDLTLDDGNFKNIKPIIFTKN